MQSNNTWPKGLNKGTERDGCGRKAGGQASFRVSAKHQGFLKNDAGSDSINISYRGWGYMLSGRLMIG